MPSNKNFGYFLFCILIGYSFYLYSTHCYFWFVFLLLAILIIGITFLRPNLLLLANKFWFKLGLAIGSLVSPIIIGVIFLSIITPIGLITKFFGRDILVLKAIKNRNLNSYWIERNPIDIKPENFSNPY